MKPQLSVSITLFAAMLFVTFFPAKLFAQGASIKPSREEIIEEVGSYTELSKDTLSLVFEENPKLLDGFGETVTAVKVLNLFYEAKDTAAMAEIYDWGWNKILDKLKDKLLPGALNTFITAVKVYKTSLELVKQHVFIPKLEERIYQDYKQARDGKNNPSLAFDDAIYTTSGDGSRFPKFKGYFILKDDMASNLIKSNGYNIDIASDKLMNHWRSKVDKFWENQLELRYQHELVRENYPKIYNDIWANSRDLRRRLLAAAEELKARQEKPLEPVKKATQKKPLPPADPAKKPQDKTPDTPRRIKDPSTPADVPTTRSKAEPPPRSTPDPNACYAATGKEIAQLRAHNQSQNPTSGGIYTRTLGKYPDCDSQYQECIGTAKQTAKNCPPDDKGTFTSCIHEENRAWINCALAELSCAEAKARVACGF